MTCGCADGQQAGIASSSQSVSVVRTYTTIAQATTNVLTTLLTETIAAGFLANNGDMLRLRLRGDWLTTASKTFTFVVVLGGVTLLTLVPGASGASAQRRTWGADLDLIRVTSTSVRLGGILQLQASVAAPVVGLGSLQGSAAGGPVESAAVDPVVDWTVDQALQFQVLPSVTGDDFTLRFGSLEKLNAA